MASKEQKNETIGLQNQSMYSSKQLKQELVDLRGLIRELASNVDDEKNCISLKEYENKMFVLNWLIEEIDFKEE